MRHRFLGLTAAVATIAALAMLGGSVSPKTASAAPTTLPACTTLVPELGAVTVNQGLGSYANEKLVRGKETLVRFYLKAAGSIGTQPPSAVGTTCSGSINVINTSSNPTRMTLIDPATPDDGDGFSGDLVPPNGQGTIAPYQTYPSAGTAISSSSVSVNSSADPIFVVPASRVNACDATPCSITTPFSLQFKARVYYTTSASSTPIFKDFSVMPMTTATPIQGNFSKLPNAFRVLVIPMGDASQLYSSQFGTAAQQAVQSGFDALSRMLPVPAGVSSTLRTTSGGIRYWIDLGAMLNLKAITGAYPPGSTNFCGTLQNFDGTAANNYQDGIKAKLAWYLQTYNANPANAAFPADRVLGVVDAAKSLGSLSNCAEGFASTISPEAWVRAIPDQRAVPSMTGSLMAMELLHTLGQENVAAGFVHSIATVADGTAPDRGYHITSRSFIANDRTALNFVNTSTAPWNSNTTLLELGAFERALCNFGGGTSSFGCTTPSEVGTDAAPAGTGHFVISATTDGTAANTAVTSSQLLQPQDEQLDDHPVLETPCLASSAYNLAFWTFADQLEGPPSTVCFVPTSGPVSEHDETTHVISTTLTIAGAFASPGGVRKVELRKGTGDDATVLHTETVQAGGLEIVGASLNPGSSFTQTETITTTSIPPIVDICLHQDESGSFAGQIETMNSLMTGEDGLIAALDATGSNYATCVTGFRDFARDNWGDAGDWVYALYADVTPGGDGFTSGVPQLTAGGGGDLPEGYLQSLDYLATPGHAAIDSNGDGDTTDDNDTPIGEDPSWRDRAKRVALLATDDACHVKGDAVDVDLGGWPGDDHTASASTTADILAANDITVIGLTPQGPGEGEIACVKTLAETTGGSVHQTSTDAETLKNAIMAGLGNLPVTVQPSADCTPGLSVSFDDESASEAAKTVESGEDVSWIEEFTVGEGASGELTCEITFLVDEVVIDTQTVNVPVDNNSSSEVQIRAPADAKADTFIECDGGQLPGQVALPSASVPGSIRTFVISADTTNACAGPNGSDPKISVLFTDGSSHELISLDGAGTTSEGGQPEKPENPTASIYAPAPDYVNPVNVPFALNGQVFDPDDGPLDDPPNPSWMITGPAGSGILLTATGNFADVSPPAGTWPLGDYTVRISGTDSDGNEAHASVIVHVRSYLFSGFIPPIRPLPTLNDGKIKSTVPIKWQLRDQAGNFITDLGVVAAIRVASTPCPSALAVCDVTPTGGTMLRYDTKTNQYVYNWLTPSTPGTYVVSVHFTDGTTYPAYFKLTK